MPDLKLGCHISPPRARDRMLKLAEFRVVLPSYPKERNWYDKGNPIGMHRNDELGICTCAGKRNLEGLWYGNAGGVCDLSDTDVTRDYTVVGNYDPTQDVLGKENPTDQGACLSDVLIDWQSGKLTGNPCGPYLAVNPTDWEEVCYAMNAGVGLYCGMSLPQGAMDAVQDPDKSKHIWTVPTSRSGRRTIGGHCVIQGSYDLEQEMADTGTWGERVPTTAEFIDHYFSEIYLIFSNDFMVDGISPSGLNGTAILDAMDQVKRRG